jgi:hypothetical protein
MKRKHFLSEQNMQLISGTVIVSTIIYTGGRLIVAILGSFCLSAVVVRKTSY